MHCILVNTAFARCSFESDLSADPACGLTTLPQGGWALETGPTKTVGTGPNGDHTTGRGNKLYLLSFK